MRKTLSVLCVLALFMASVSCRKLDESANPTGPLTYESAKFADAIPQEYGALIGVTQNSNVPGWVTLWFQKPDGAITAMGVNVRDGKISNKTLTIPRR